MDEINSYIYPTIGICIEDIDRLDPKEYKFTIPSINFNKDSSKEDKTELKNQGITNIANDKNINIGKVEVNNYFMIYIPKEIMCDTYTEFGMSGTIEGSGSNISEADISIPILRSINRRYIGNIRQTFNSIMISIKTAKTNNGIKIIPKDNIIKKGSQWIIVFIDGDPSKPAVIARYK